jgi:hypothetical protein
LVVSDRASQHHRYGSNAFAIRRPRGTAREEPLTANLEVARLYGRSTGIVQADKVEGFIDKGNFITTWGQRGTRDSREALNPLPVDGPHYADRNDSPVLVLNVKMQ